MGARQTPQKGCQGGNFVAEWFGHRVWQALDESTTAWKNHSGRLCPFLTTATESQTLCIKRARGWTEPYGVCTISSDSNGVRQDWIACPYRTLDHRFTLLASAVKSAYDIQETTGILLLPLTVLHRPDQRRRILKAFQTGVRVFLFSSQKLGGEIDLPETEASPGAAVDMSVIEVTETDDHGTPSDFGNHLFYEIQTSDFHGSPLHAAALLRDACPKDGPRKGYYDKLKSSIEICGTGVEGPNKANIFKRTIYQMIFKIELTRAPQCSGFAIILPVPVWESWLRHLGRPQLVQGGDDPRYVALRAPQEMEETSGERARATVYVFDIDRESNETPSPLKVIQEVSISAGSLSYHAFELASNEAISRGVVTSFRKSFMERVDNGWKGNLRSR
jgi:hypothetical protein